MDQPLTFASVWRRSCAGIIDFLLVAVFMTVFSILANSSKSTAYVLLPLMWGTILLYPVVLHKKFGATLGKLAMGVRVTCTDTRPISWGRSFARSAVDLTFSAYWMTLVLPATFALPPDTFQGQHWGDLFQTVKQQFPESYETTELYMAAWYYVDFLTMLFNRKRRTLHDFIAGTVVISGRAVTTPFSSRPPSATIESQA